jgi:hypothetical protein
MSKPFQTINLELNVDEQLAHRDLNISLKDSLKFAKSIAQTVHPNQIL